MVKVLIVGQIATSEHWHLVHARVEKLQKSTHGPFDALLVLSHRDHLHEEDLPFSLPLFCFQDSTLSNMEIEEMQIVMIPKNAELKQDVQKVDLVLSHAFPNGFQRHLPKESIPETVHQVSGNVPLQQWISTRSPRYHIVAGEAFYARPPYLNTDGSYTRMIVLAPVSTSTDKKVKWMHALNIPLEAAALPTGTTTTDNPYILKVTSSKKMSNKRKVTGGLSEAKVLELQARSQANATSFLYQNNSNNVHEKFASHDHSKRGRGGRHKDPVPPRRDCWFCLATPSVEKHLITSIGNECYLACPKGAIVPDHVLIVPIAHESSLLGLTEEATSEIHQYKSALQTFFATQKKSLIVFERNVETIGVAHGHLQIVPIPNDKIERALDLFHSEGSQYNMKFEICPSLEIAREKANGHHYFYVEIITEKETVRLLHLVTDRHYLQFGRHVAATLLETPRRADWKYCVLPFKEEEALASAFKSGFKPYDFTLE